MTTQFEQFPWDAVVAKKYALMIQRMPLFHREIARQVVDKTSVELAKARGASQVEEQDVVRAFCAGVPKAFYSLMVRLFEEVGFSYREYETK